MISTRQYHLVWYGSEPLSPTRFRSVENDTRCWLGKPRTGGLWTSPAGSRRSWERYVSSSSHMTYRSLHRHDVDFRGRVLRVETARDLSLIPWYPTTVDRMTWLRGCGLDRTAPPDKQPDWARLAKEVDAIHITCSGLRLSPFATGWDCETVLILDPERTLGGVL